MSYQGPQAESPKLENSLVTSTSLSLLIPTTPTSPIPTTPPTVENSSTSTFFTQHPSVIFSQKFQPYPRGSFDPEASYEKAAQNIYLASNNSPNLNITSTETVHGDPKETPKSKKRRRCCCFVW